jgi:hypothetical protein
MKDVHADGKAVEMRSQIPLNVARLRKVSPVTFYGNGLTQQIRRRALLPRDNGKVKIVATAKGMFLGAPGRSK